jgi:hypothetical protein
MPNSTVELSRVRADQAETGATSARPDALPILLTLC